MAQNETDPFLEILKSFNLGKWILTCLLQGSLYYIYIFLTKISLFAYLVGLNVNVEGAVVVLCNLKHRLRALREK